MSGTIERNEYKIEIDDYGNFTLEKYSTLIEDWYFIPLEPGKSNWHPDDIQRLVEAAKKLVIKHIADNPHDFIPDGAA